MHIVVEHRGDGYVAFPLGLEHIVFAEGATSDEAMDNANAALREHILRCGPDALEETPAPPYIDPGGLAN